MMNWSVAAAAVADWAYYAFPPAALSFHRQYGEAFVAHHLRARQPHIAKFTRRGVGRSQAE
jgi:hypothetical protein